MLSDSAERRKANAKKLAEGYTWQKRLCEICAISLFWILWLTNFVRISRLYVHSADLTMTDRFLALPSIFTGILFADFLSGVAHWAFDTWGSCETPLFGAFIRSFREHHVDQTAITRHDFIETNGDNAMPIIPPLAAMLFFPAYAGGTGWCSPLFQVFLISTTIFIAFTNQFHQLSHRVKQPYIIRWMMDRGIIMSVQHHRVHHSGDFSAYYCITTGWLNAPLDSIGFWRGMERIITAVSGIQPRADDKVLLAAE